MELIISLVMLALTYYIGNLIEMNHYQSIKERERMYINLPIVTGKNFLPSNVHIIQSELVYGNIVISIDYFKRFLALLRNIVGGEVSSYETLVDRARREAILRMKERASGAGIILNFRIETSMIGQSANKKGKVGSV